MVSSEVAKYTAIKHPRVIILLEYKLLAITENPHCGIIEAIAPINTPLLSDFFSSELILSA